MSTPSVEERLAILESEVATLRTNAASTRPGVIGRTAPDFLSRFVGIHANSAVFDSVVRKVEEERERQRESAKSLVVEDAEATEPA